MANFANQSDQHQALIKHMGKARDLTARQDVTKTLYGEFNKANEFSAALRLV